MQQATAEKIPLCRQDYFAIIIYSFLFACYNVDKICNKSQVGALIGVPSSHY